MIYEFFISTKIVEQFLKMKKQYSNIFQIKSTEYFKSKDKEIEELKEEKHSLKTTLEFWKDKFLRVMSLIKDKLFGKEKEREKYFDVSKDLYKKGIIKEDTFNELRINIILLKNMMIRGKMILR